MGEVREKCAVVGVFDPQEAAIFAAEGLSKLDHRGPDATGVAGLTKNGDSELFHQPGRASRVLTPECIGQLGDLGMTAVVAHGRYPTSAGADVVLPARRGTGRSQIIFAENGNASNLAPLEAYLDQQNIATSGMNDSQMKAAAIAHERKRGASTVEAIARIYPKIIGGHACILASTDENGAPMLAVFRDEHGIRPLEWGHTRNGGYMFASETVGLDAAGAIYGGEVNPGELITIGEGGMHRYQLAPAKPRHDPFELLYFSNKRSRFKGQLIGNIRAALGARLAAEYGAEIIPGALAVAIPNSARPYTQGYADASGGRLTYDPEILTKITDDRTFLGNTPEERAAMRDAIYKLNGEAIRGRAVETLDDTIVRNNTMPYHVRRFREAGATRINVRIGAPPIRYPNFCGVAIADQDELVAANMDMRAQRDKMRCDRLGHISMEGMLEVFYDLSGEPGDHFDLSCFNGDYPVDIGRRNIRVPKYADYAA